MSAVIILVNGDAATLRKTEAQLADCGYLVSAASSFASARDLLRAVRPDVLVTALHLSRYNGIHLALHYRAHYPNLPVIVTHTTFDEVAKSEAERCGFSFVADPLNNAQFVASVRSLVERSAATTGVRVWRRKRMAGIIEAQLQDARGRILDMSYSGLRLAFCDDERVPDVFDLTVPQAGITVRAQRVWTKPSPARGEFWCGAELALASPADETRWREFVDSV